MYIYTYMYIYMYIYIYVQCVSAGLFAVISNITEDWVEVCVCVFMFVLACACLCACVCVRAYMCWSICLSMGWLRLVGSIKL